MQVQRYLPRLLFLHGRGITRSFSFSGNDRYPDVARGNDVITQLCTEGRMKEARKVFDEMPVRNVTSWACMILGYRKMGMSELGLHVFRDMIREGVSRPNRDMFVCVLDMVSDLTALFEGLQMHQMVIKTRFESDSFVRSALVNMYTKCGEVGFARKMFDFSSQRDSVSHGSLISTHVNCNEEVKFNKGMKKKIALGPNVADLSFQNKMYDSGTYMLLSNIYASAGKYKEAAKIRARMNEKGLKKQPGCSWIEIRSRVHVFVVRDKSHCETDAIYRLVHDIHGFMRMNGQDYIYRDMIDY